MPVFNDEIIQKLFGREDAENESPERLKEIFFRNKAYENLTANLPIRILVGHKGAGKSALLKIAYEEDQARNIVSLWLRPDDVRAAVPELGDGDLNKRIDAWKRALTHLIAREIANSYCTEAIEAVASEGAIASIKDIIGFAKEIFAKQIDKGISYIKKSAIENFNRTNVVRVYLDDLDRGWEAKKSDIRNISALLNAIRDLCGSKNTLQFRIGLRSDVYFLVRTSDESTDKIESNLIFLTWINHEILVLAAKRIESFFGRPFDEATMVNARQADIARYLDSVIEPRFLGAGKWENVPIHRVLLSMVRHRPRDLVKLFIGAAKAAHRKDHTIITTGDLQETFEAYSNERLQDLVNEFGTEFPKLANLLRGMRPTKKAKYTLEQFAFSNDELSKKLKDLISQNSFAFTNKSAVNIHSLGQLLYKIDFLIARKQMDDGTILRKYFDQNRYLNDQFVDFGFDWEIHPAYRWALQPTDAASIFHVTALDPDVEPIFSIEAQPPAKEPRRPKRLSIEPKRT